MTWQLRQHLKEKFSRELGRRGKPARASISFALGYPNTYHVGMSNLGLQILYREINSRSDTTCERFFLPDRAEWSEYIRSASPIYTVETQRPLGEFPLVAFAVSFELDYVNLVTQLAQSRIPLWSQERGERDPLIIVGGPCATFNPEPLADLTDIFVVGEGEVVIHSLLDVYQECRRAGLDREAILHRMASIPGLYIPRFYRPRYDENRQFNGMEFKEGVPEQIDRQKVTELEAHAGYMEIQTEDTEFGNMFLVEVARGCGRHCRFCMAGYCFRQPRYRSVDSILTAVRMYCGPSKKVGLVGAAVSDHPDIEEICRRLLDEGYQLSMASLRADSLTLPMVQALAQSGHKTLTLAPEAATRRLRDILNKGIHEEDLLHAVDLAIQARIPNLRLYIMVGLPTETEEDIAAIGDLARRIRRRMSQGGLRGRLTLSVNPFIPKPFTPFQWLPVGDLDRLMDRIGKLRHELDKEWGIELIAEKAGDAYVQAILARGDRRMGEVLIENHGQGNKGLYKRWRRASNLEQLLYRVGASIGIPLPWGHINIGVDQAYLAAEEERAMQGRATSVCQEGCRRCGVC